MVRGEDYGVIPGTGSKPSLLKPGAEKLLTYHGFAWELHLETEVFKTTDPVEVRFVYSGRVIDKRSGIMVVGGLEGEANSYEDKYHWRWYGDKQLPKEWHDRREELLSKPGKYGVRYRVPADGPSILGLANTLRKMAQKRCLVALALAATRASGSFTQDVEDMSPEQLGNTSNVQKSAPSKGASSDGPPADGAWTEHPMSGAQKGFLGKVAEEAGLNGDALNTYCEGKFNKPYAKKVENDAELQGHKDAERLLSEDHEWAFTLTKKEASALIDAIKEGQVSGA
jgi:hypothetical protein